MKWESALSRSTSSMADRRPRTLSLWPRRTVAVSLLGPFACRNLWSSQAAENRTHQSLGTPVGGIQRRSSFSAVTDGQFRRRTGSGAATDKASVSAILATCSGSQKHSGGSGCGSWSNVFLARGSNRRSWFRASPLWCGARPDHVLARGCESVPHRTRRRPSPEESRDAGRRRRHSWDRDHDARPVPNRRRAPHARSSWPRPAGHPRFSSPTLPARTTAFLPPRTSSAGPAMESVRGHQTEDFTQREKNRGDTCDSGRPDQGASFCRRWRSSFAG